MERLTLTLMFFCVCCGLAYAGTAYSGKEMKEVAPAPCPQWYADNEWNVSLWGTYAATGTEFAPNPSLADIVQSTQRATLFTEPLISILEAITPGAAVSISGTFSAVISALVWRDLS